MTNERSFRYGGVRLPYKKLHVEYPIPNAFLPTDAVIPLRQHAGQSAKRVVEPGEYIREGQLIGKAVGAGSANVHSPIPGLVKSIKRIPDIQGDHVEAVAVALEGAFDRLGKKTEVLPWRSLSKHQILRALADKGVVDDDGSGSILFDRLHDPNGERGPCVLVVNCIESDPWFSSAEAILHERAEAVAEGIDILKRILSPQRSLLAIEGAGDGLPDVFRSPSAYDDAKLEILSFKSQYPQDLPTLLREAIIGRKTCSENVITVTVSTVASVYDAVVLNKSQIERYVTVVGDAVKEPGILRARIGTSVGELLEECGGFRAAPESILMNGPLRGSAVADLDLPVLKTTRSIVALTSAETHRGRTTSCIRCGRCVLGCPERIDPSRLYKRVVRRDWEEAAREGLYDCTECGTCAYLCPSRLPLVQVISLARREAARNGLSGKAEGRIV